MPLKSNFLHDHTAPRELWAALEPLATAIKKTSGDILFRRGEQPVGVFLVRVGAVNLGMEESQSADRDLGSGSILGLPATLTGRPYGLTAIAIEDSQLDFVPRKVVIDLLRENTALCFQAIQLLSGEISEINFLRDFALRRTSVRPKPRITRRNRFS
jgi:CRP-like cAMP-binding protein